MPKQEQPPKKKPGFRETPAPKPAPPKKRTAPVDTVALKKQVSDDSTSFETNIGIAARSRRRSSDESKFTQAAYGDAIEANRGRALLDSARAGQVPAKPSGRARIAAAMTKKKGKP